MNTIAPAPKEVLLDNPDYFINRELSLLEFNRRVLAQARNKKTPLLERLFFLCIASSTMDEFFEIRVSGLKQQVAYGSTQRGPDNLSPSEQLELINNVAHGLQTSQYKILNDEVLPALANEDIHFLHHDRWNQTETADAPGNQWVRRRGIRASPTAGTFHHWTIKRSFSVRAGNFSDLTC